MDVSVVIPTRNKATRLRLLLQCLIRQQFHRDWEVVVVDDASADATADIIKHAREQIPVRVVPLEQKQGRGSARNVGACDAGGDVILFCDDDLLVTPMFVQTHYEAHTHKINSLVRGPVENLPQVRFFDDPVTGTFVPGAASATSYSGIRAHKVDEAALLRGEFETIRRSARPTALETLARAVEAQNIAKLAWCRCAGANLSIPRDLFLSVGGFARALDEWWGAEDLELGVRLTDSGVMPETATQGVGYHMAHARPAFREDHKRAFARFADMHPNHPEIPDVGTYLRGEMELGVTLGRVSGG